SQRVTGILLRWCWEQLLPKTNTDQEEEEEEEEEDPAHPLDSDLWFAALPLITPQPVGRVIRGVNGTQETFAGFGPEALPHSRRRKLRSPNVNEQLEESTQMQAQTKVSSEREFVWEEGQGLCGVDELMEGRPSMADLFSPTTPPSSRTCSALTPVSHHLIKILQHLTPVHPPRLFHQLCTNNADHKPPY
ncbi:hypothetical protein GBF38_015672, partial [Nibea albiflora]